jgi:ubiquinone/menaquinone biosynthesis C-methylase UbiE
MEPVRRSFITRIHPPRTFIRCRMAIALRLNRHKSDRRLEIGPGQDRLPGFETLSIEADWHTDYLCDAAEQLPFEDGSFVLVYASHVLEHIPWYQVEGTLKEWRRILRPGGHLEVWVPDGLKICKALADAEENGRDYTHLDGWYKFNPEKDPCVWAAGRLFTYGDGKGRLDHPNWHRAIFTPRYLKVLFEKVGLTQIRELTHEEVRGHDHGWISLGVVGVKP